jgi:hypothetical protein
MTKRMKRFLLREISPPPSATPEEAQFVFEKENDKPVLYVEFHGKRIAKRYFSQPGWITLVPGYTVRGTEQLLGPDADIIEIDYDPKAAEPR